MLLLELLCLQYYLSLFSDRKQINRKHLEYFEANMEFLIQLTKVGKKKVFEKLNSGESSLQLDYEMSVSDE